MRLVSAGILRPTTESEKNKNCNKREFGGILIIYVSDCIYNISLPNIFISVRQFQFKKRTNEWINSGRLSLGFWVIISSHTFYFIKLNFSRLHLSFNFSGLRVMEKLNWSFIYVVYGGLHTQHCPHTEDSYLDCYFLIFASFVSVVSLPSLSLLSFCSGWIFLRLRYFILSETARGGKEGLPWLWYVWPELSASHRQLLLAPPARWERLRDLSPETSQI